MGCNVCVNSDISRSIPGHGLTSAEVLRARRAAGCAHEFGKGQPEWINIIPVHECACLCVCVCVCERERERERVRERVVCVCRTCVCVCVCVSVCVCVCV